MRKIDLFILFLVIIVFGLLVYNIQMMRDEGPKCLQNPLVYGAKKLSDNNNAEFIGSGSFSRPNSPIVRFNSYNLTVDFPEVPSTSNTFSLDLSTLNLSFK